MLNLNKKPTILIVDDEVDILISMERPLRFKYNVITTSDSLAVLDILKNNHVDCVLMDIRMPGINGIELLKEIKFIFLHMPIIIMTGHGGESDAIQALKYGASGYIRKPIDIYKLFDELKKVINQEKASPKSLIKILIYESDKEFLKYLSKELSEHSYIIDTADTQDGVLESLFEKEPDVLILALHITNGTELEFVEKIKEIHPSILIILITDKSNQELAINSISIGVFDYIKKPFRIEELISSIEHGEYKININRELKQKDKQLKIKSDTLSELNDKISTQKQYLRNIIESMENMLMVTDITGNIVMTNDVALTRLKYDKKDFIELSISKILPKDDFETLMEQISLKGQATGFESKYLDKHGEVVPVLISCSIIHYPDKKRDEIIFIAQDITERKLAEKKLHDLSCFDHLTKLPNRSYFKKIAEKSIEETINKGKSLVFIILDLDNFKAVNDRLGYFLGDQILNKVSKRIRKAIRQEDCIARFGGDEFILFLNGVSNEEVLSIVVNKIINLINQPFLLNGEEIYLGVSMGAVFVPRFSSNYEEILQYADIALYKAKSSGRNQCQIFSETIKEEYGRHFEIDNALHFALKKEEFHLEYQPIYDVKNKKIHAVEALLRWQSAELGIISPDEFIPIAETNGLIMPISNWVINEALSQLEKWQKQGHDELYLAINLSPVQLNNTHYLVEILNEAIKNYHISPDKVELEITETAIMQNLNQAASALAEFDSLGFKISIDDFGKGYSSLSLLSKLPFSILKIDKEFIHNYENKKNRKIINIILSLSKELNLEVIAEGVETKEQLAYLEKNGCQYCQGYYFSKPKKPKELKFGK